MSTEPLVTCDCPACHGSGWVESDEPPPELDQDEVLSPAMTDEELAWWAEQENADCLSPQGDAAWQERERGG